MNKKFNNKIFTLIYVFTIIIATVALSSFFVDVAYSESVENENSESVSFDKSKYGINKSYTSKNIEIPKRKTYRITPKSKPIGKEFIKSITGNKTYNKHTKHYYTIISYMKKFDKSGGGTLILKKGTYYITESIAVPSKVNIILENGVVLKKWMKTDTPKLKASTAVFQLVKPSAVKGQKRYSKYSGTKNVNIIGKGTATIDLRYKKKALAIVCGHNKNIRIEGITFKNMNNGHFIELDATNNIKIRNCKFIRSKPSTNLVKEAINLDTPDKSTKGFNNPWTKYDKTPNKNVLIENNIFNKVDRAIGTHKYSQSKYNDVYTVNKGQKYHSNIIIRNNKITNTRTEGIRILNWKNALVVNNYIGNIPSSSNARGILATGCNIKIKYNYFVNLPRAIQFKPSKNNENGDEYSVTYNFLTERNKNDLKYNLCKNVKNSYATFRNLLKYTSNEEIINMLIEN